jgi:hypothetical protein
VIISKPAAFIMVEGGRTWFRTSAETEEAIRTGFTMETVTLYTAPPKREPLSEDEMRAIWKEGVRGEIPFVEIGRAIEKAHGITGGGE